MTHQDFKRLVGYNEPDFKSVCSTCRNCVRRGNHLRCAKWYFEVSAVGLCRNGYEPHDLHLNSVEHPLLVK